MRRTGYWSGGRGTTPPAGLVFDLGPENVVVPAQWGANLTQQTFNTTTGHWKNPYNDGIWYPSGRVVQDLSVWLPSAWWDPVGSLNYNVTIPAGLNVLTVELTPHDLTSQGWYPKDSDNHNMTAGNARLFLNATEHSPAQATAPAPPTGPRQKFDAPPWDEVQLPDWGVMSFLTPDVIPTTGGTGRHPRRYVGGGGGSESVPVVDGFVYHNGTGVLAHTWEASLPYMVPYTMSPDGIIMSGGSWLYAYHRGGDVNCVHYVGLRRSGDRLGFFYSVQGSYFGPSIVNAPGGVSWLNHPHGTLYVKNADNSIVSLGWAIIADEEG